MLRAIAIILVLFSHSTLLLFPNQKHIIITSIQFLGTIGVDLFFVLSGYLIGGLILKQLKNVNIKFKDFQYFWIRRWFRTLPNYFLILVLNILIVFLFKNEFIKGLGSYFVFLQNFTKPHPDFFTEAWSLSIEEYSYIIGPVLLYILITLFSKKNKINLFLFVTLLVIVLAHFLRLHFHFSNTLDSMHSWSSKLRKVVIYRLDAIYYGFLAIYLVSKYQVKVLELKKILFSIGILVFLGIHASIFIYDLQPENASFFYNMLYLPLVSVSLLLLFPVFVNWKQGHFLKNIITKISILSYGLYLVNYSLVLLTLQYFFDVQIMSMSQKGILLISFWLISFVLSYILYNYYEKPITDLRDSEFIKKKIIK